jgi:hypothetical protein
LIKKPRKENNISPYSPTCPGGGDGGGKFEVTLDEVRVVKIISADKPKLLEDYPELAVRQTLKEKPKNETLLIPWLKIGSYIA